MLNIGPRIDVASHRQRNVGVSYRTFARGDLVAVVQVAADKNAASHRIIQIRITRRDDIPIGQTAIYIRLEAEYSHRRNHQTKCD